MACATDSYRAVRRLYGTRTKHARERNMSFSHRCNASSGCRLCAQGDEDDLVAWTGDKLVGIPLERAKFIIGITLRA